MSRTESLCLSISILSFGVLTSQLHAQDRHLINDRTNDTIYRAVDGNSDDFVDDLTEINIWFNSLNAAGTLAISNPTSLAISAKGEAAMGDQGNAVVYFLRDRNCDGDAQDLGESIVYADATNASGISFAFPTGCEFGPDGALYVVNAGNTSGDDGIYRLVDLNNDGDAQDAGEITVFVGPGALGPGNGPYSPQEIIIDATGVVYLRNSTTNLHGVYRCEDLNTDDDADDPAEFTVFWDVNNADSTPATAGFAVDFDRARPNALYTLQLASGGIDQLVRLQDLNSDDDAQDAGESAIVWSTAEAGFTSVDMICRDNGDVMISDASGLRIILLHDMTNDGDFDDAGERTDYFTNANATLGTIRQFNPVRLLGDLNDDGVVNVTDLFQLLAAWNTPGPGDLNGDGTVDVTDLFKLLANWNACL